MPFIIEWTVMPALSRIAYGSHKGATIGAIIGASASVVLFTAIEVYYASHDYPKALRRDGIIVWTCHYLTTRDESYYISDAGTALFFGFIGAVIGAGKTRSNPKKVIRRTRPPSGEREAPLTILEQRLREQKKKA